MCGGRGLREIFVFPSQFFYELKTAPKIKSLRNTCTIKETYIKNEQVNDLITNHSKYNEGT